jgi:hypothetical protein
MLLKAQTAFAQEWGTFNGLDSIPYEEGGLDWVRATRQQQSDFVQYLLGAIGRSDPVPRLKKLEALVYILLGCWHESAGLGSTEAESDEGASQASLPRDGHAPGTYDKSAQHVQLIRKLCVFTGLCRRCGVHWLAR